jgi:hypothetical protein
MMSDLNTGAAQGASGGDWLDKAGNWLSGQWNKAMHAAADNNDVSQALHGAGALADKMGMSGAGKWLNAAGDGVSTGEYNALNTVTGAAKSLGSMAYNLSPQGYINAAAKAAGLPVDPHAPDAGAVLKPMASTITHAVKTAAPYALRYAEGDPTLAPELAGKAADAAYDRYVKPFATNDPETGFNHLFGDAGTAAGVIGTAALTDGIGEMGDLGLAGRLGTLGEDGAPLATRGGSLLERTPPKIEAPEPTVPETIQPPRTPAPGSETALMSRNLDSELDSLAARGGGKRTAGVGATNVPGLENDVIEAGSTGVRKALGTEATPGPIKAPYDYSDPDYAAFVKHAEEEFGNQFVQRLSDAGYKPNAEGVYDSAQGTARFYMNASDKGVCNHCMLNLRSPSPSGASGVVQQLSAKVPNVKFVFQTAGKPENTVTVMGGRIVPN